MLESRRIGMFVVTGARDRLTRSRRTEFRRVRASVYRRLDLVDAVHTRFICVQAAAQLSVTDQTRAKGQGLVLGASSDIGRAVAVGPGRLGYELNLWGRDSDRLSSTTDECRRLGQAVAADQVDVTNAPS